MPHTPQPIVPASTHPASCDVSVIVPVYGCRGCLEELVQRCSHALAAAGRSCEIILVDDSSPDDAWPRIAELAAAHPFVRGLRLSRNFGQHAAISAGLAHAAGEVIVVMDCDLQDVPEEIPKLLAALQPGIEIALGQRVDRQDSWLKQLGSRGFYRALGWLTDTRYDHSTANFGAYSRKVIDTINRMPEQDRFFPLLARWTGFATVRVPVAHAPRSQGRSSYRLGTLVRLAARIALSFSDKPLRLVIKGSLWLAVLSLAIAAFAVDQYFGGNVRVAGYTSIIASIWLIGSAIMFCLGVLGLYVGKLHAQSKQRPNYIVWQDTQGP